jgi:hypothetical protein
VALCAGVAASVPSQTQAQELPIELGIDGAISYALVDAGRGAESANVQTWAFPVQRLRIAFFPMERFQLQSTMAFSVADFGEVSTVRFALGLAAVYHVTGDGVRSGLFAMGGGAFNLLSHNGSDVQWSLGGGLGYEFPMGDRLAFRPALEIARSPASHQRLGNTTVSAVVGLSFFTR